jgi:hypothetical protein
VESVDALEVERVIVKLKQGPDVGNDEEAAQKRRIVPRACLCAAAVRDELLPAVRRLESEVSEDNAETHPWRTKRGEARRGAGWEAGVAEGADEEV